MEKRNVYEILEGLVHLLLASNDMWRGGGIHSTDSSLPLCYPVCMFRFCQQDC